MNMLERDDSGSHKFHYTQVHLTTDEGFFSSMAFWRDKPVDYSGVFMTHLQPDGENTRVYLLFGTGESVDTSGAEHILGIFMGPSIVLPQERDQSELSTVSKRRYYWGGGYLKVLGDLGWL